MRTALSFYGSNVPRTESDAYPNAAQRESGQNKMKMYRRELSPLRGVVCHLLASSSLEAEERPKSGSTHSRAAVRLAHQINCALLSDCDAIIQKEEGQNRCEKGTWKCLSFVKSSSLPRSL